MADPPVEEILSFPVSDNEVIEVRVDELPEDAHDLIEIFTGERVPLFNWIRFAKVYYAQGKEKQFADILSAGSQKEVLQNHSDDPDAVTLLLTLASYYLQKAAEDPEKRDSYSADAFHCLNLSDRIDPNQIMSFVGKGQYHLIRNNYDTAMIQFDAALDMERDHIPSLLSKASIHYCKGKYLESLKSYSRVIEVCSNAPAEVRLGIAMCHYKLGNLDACRRAFTRVLEMNPDSSDALAGLAILELNSEGSGALANGLKLLERAYKTDKRHPIVLNQLANHYFYRKEYDKALKFATLAYHIADSPEVKAESSYIIGRNNHRQEQYGKAFQFYSQAEQENPDYLPAAFGLGQMHIHRRDYQKAIQCFLKVERQYPDDRPTMKALAILHAHSPEKVARDNAYARLRTYVDRYPDDMEVFIELAQLSETTRPRDSLESYETAVKLFDSKGVPAGLWNNIGAVRHRVSDGDPKKIESAGEAYGRALQAAGSSVEDFGPESVTTVYNIARLMEDAQQYDKATELYQSILKKQPKYVDCLLRLGAMAQKCGSKDEAMSLFKEAIGIDKDNADAWILFGNLHLKYEEWAPAQRKYEHVLNKIDQRDSYSLLSLGNIFYYTSHSTTDKSKARRFLDHALRYYVDVLKRDAYNVYAACGAGIILAERGRLAQAREVLNDVCQVADSKSAWLNVAHMQLARGQFEQANATYQTVLKRFHGSQDHKLLNIAGKALFEAKDFSMCVAMLQKAVHVCPHDPSLRFNLALAKKELARRTLRDPLSTAKQCESASSHLEQAASIFAYLSKDIPSRTEHSHGSVNLSQVAALDRGVSSLLTEVESIVRDKRVEEEKNEKKKLELEKELHEKEQERLESERRLVEEQTLKDMKEKEVEENLSKKHENLMKRQMEGMEETGRKRKRKKDGFSDNLAALEEAITNEPEATTNNPNLNETVEDVAVTMAEIFGDSSSEDEAGGATDEIQPGPKKLRVIDDEEKE